MLLLIFPLSIVLARTGPPTNVDKLVSALDSVSASGYVNNWKVSADLSTAALSGDPTSASYDDSGWKDLKIGGVIGADSCWIRKVVTLPATLFGKPVRGRVGLFVALDNYGYMWINGKSEGYFPFDKEFLLTDDAKPGMKFVVAMKAVNGGANLHLLEAALCA